MNGALSGRVARRWPGWMRGKGIRVTRSFDNICTNVGAFSNEPHSAESILGLFSTTYGHGTVQRSLRGTESGRIVSFIVCFVWVANTCW